VYALAARSDTNTFRTLFDAANPDAPADGRPESTVAPQALFFLNDPLAVAQAAAVAGRSEREAGADPAARVGWLYRALYARPAGPDEVRHGTAAAARLGWPAYAQALLAANEFLYLD
jgi:hypothetical protein